MGVNKSKHIIEQSVVKKTLYNKPFISHKIDVDKKYEKLNKLCEVVTKVTNFPISCITVIKEKNQYFIGKFGIDINHTSIDVSLCNIVFNNQNAIYISDTKKKLFTCNTKLPIKTYIGIPIIINNRIEAVLCTFSFKKKLITKTVVDYLKTIALLTGSKIELIYKIQLENIRLQENEKFIRILSHEINTCLHTILSSAEYFEENTKDDEDTKWATVLKDSSKTINEVVGDILLYQKLENNKKTNGNICIVDIKLFLNKIKSLFIYNKIKILINNVPKRCKINKSILTRVLINVLNNSKKYSKDKNILINVKTLHNNSNFIEIECIDNGPGINNIDKMIKPFEQSSIKNEGIGLGLTLCKQLCETINGSFNIKNRTDSNGVIVSFTIPIYNIDYNVTSTYNVPNLIQISPTIEKKCIKCSSINSVLIVDDTNICRQILKKQIEKISKNVIIDEATNGKMAIDMCENKLYDIVFMDYNMPPGINGVEASKQIKNTKIVLVTAEILVDCNLDNIQKPFNISKLQSLFNN